MSAANTNKGTNGPIGYDVATALWQGKRPYQEDSLLADFHGGMDRGFAVLADGMGGHAAGDLASRLVVIDAVSHLKFLMHDGAALEKNLKSELTSAIQTANDVLKDRGASDRRLQGMGATFLATVLFEDRLYWASVGDSPLYLWREGELRQLNEDHSMAPIIDQMAKTGELSEEEAANHPDRNALTSVLMGGNLKSMDVPATATVLDPGDVLIQASDGLQYLDEARIVEVLKGMASGASSRAITDALMQALYDLDDPVQDNTAIMVLQLCEGLGDGGGGVAKKGMAAKNEGERAIVAAAVAMAKKGDAAPLATRMLAEDGDAAEEDASSDDDAAPVATVAGDVDASAEVSTPPPEGRRRRILVPAALLGGAAVALGLIFGLPSEQEGFVTEAALEDSDSKAPGGEAVAAAPDDPVVEVEAADADADPDAADEGATGEDTPSPDAAPHDPAAEEETSETPALDEAPDEDAAPEGDDEPAQDPAPEADVAPEEDAAAEDGVGAEEDVAPEDDVAPAQDATPEEDAAPESLAVAETAPDTTDAEPDASPDAEPEPDTEAPADDGAPAPAAEDPDQTVEGSETPEIATEGEDTTTSTATDGEADLDAPAAAPGDTSGAEPEIEAGTTEDMPQEIVSTETDGDVVDRTAPDASETGGASTGGLGAQIEVEGNGTAQPEIGESFGTSNGTLGVVPQVVPGADGDFAPAAPLQPAAPLPAPTTTPAPAPVPAPAPAAPAPTIDGAAPTPVPGVGPLREGLEAPSDDGTAAPALPQPQIVPESDTGRLVPQVINPGITQDGRAGQTVPRNQPNVLPGVPMLPPFAGNIQRFCQDQQCFAIIRQPDGSVAILQRRR